MARGFLSGVLWGGVIGVAASSVVSLLSPQPQPPQVSDAAPGVAEAPERVPATSSGETGSESDRVLVTGQVAPQTTPPDPDTLTPLGEGTTRTAALPETGGADRLAEPINGDDVGGVSVQADAPVLPNPQALAPMAPQAADEVSISTEPAQPPAPEAPEVEGAFDAPEQPQTQEVATAEAALPEAPDQPQSQEVVAAEEVAPTAEVAQMAEPVEAEEPVPAQEPVETRPAGQTEAPVAQDEAIAEPAPAPEPDIAVAQVAPEIGAVDPPATGQDAEVAALPRDAEDAPADPPATQLPQELEEPEPDREAQTAQAPTEVVDADAETDDRPRIGRPAGRLTDRNTDVAIRRPGVATLGEIDDDGAEEAAVDANMEADADPRPISRYAQAFDDPEGKPLMSIVLIDDGTSPVSGSAGIAALQSFPYPLSFAVDASLDDAADRMATYRRAGFEVLAMVDLPEGAQPGDAETAFGAILPRLPEVVGVLEGTQGGFQGARDVSDQVTSILRQTGHGLLTQSKGLNTMPKLARKEGVPAEPVFRDFDSKGQTAQVIRRFLDQAAFKAGQEGAVVMLGRLRPDTISALLLWGLQDRAGKVALTPISAVLLREG